MKNFKKILSSVLVFVMLFTVSFSVLANEGVNVDDENENQEEITGSIEVGSDVTLDGATSGETGTGEEQQNNESNGSGGTGGTGSETPTGFTRNLSSFVLSGLGGAAHGVGAGYATGTDGLTGTLTVNKGEFAYIQANSTDAGAPPWSGYYAAIGIVAPDGAAYYTWNTEETVNPVVALDGNGKKGYVHYAFLYDANKNALNLDTYNKRTIKWFSDAAGEDEVLAETFKFLGAASSSSSIILADKTETFKVLGKKGSVEYEFPVYAGKVGATAVDGYYTVDVDGFDNLSFRTNINNTWTSKAIDTVADKNGDYWFNQNGDTVYISKNVYKVEGAVTGRTPSNGAVTVHLVPWGDGKSVFDAEEAIKGNYVSVECGADSAGKYTFSNVLPGKYEIRVLDENNTTKTAGFATIVSTSVSAVNVEAKALLNVTVPEATADPTTNIASPAPVNAGSAPYGVPNKVGFRLKASAPITGPITVKLAPYSMKTSTITDIEATIEAAPVTPSSSEISITPMAAGDSAVGTTTGDTAKDLVFAGGLAAGETLVINVTTTALKEQTGTYGYALEVVDAAGASGTNKLLNQKVSMTADVADTTINNYATVKYHHILRTTGGTTVKSWGDTLTVKDGDKANVGYVGNSGGSYSGYDWYVDNVKKNSSLVYSTLFDEVVEGGKTYEVTFYYVYGSSSSGSSVGGANPNYYGATSVLTPTGENATRFYDTGITPWAEEAIEKLAQLGVINGKTDKTFEPESNITREEFTKIVLGAFRIKPLEGVPTGFNDVESGAWYEQYIAAAVSAGFINGYEDGSFGVGKFITREEVSAILFRAINDNYIIAITNDSDFADNNDVQQWAAAAVATLANNGLVNGYDDGTFGPKRNTTRAEAAVLVHRVYVKYVQ